MDEYDEALARYDRVIELLPESAEAHNNRAIILNKMKRHAEALVSFGKAIALTPRHAELYNNRGVALQDIGRLEDALADYDKAIELKPAYANAHTNRGAILATLGRYYSALASCNQAIELTPDSTEAHNNRGVALQGMGRYDEALASYDQALTLTPDCVEAHSNRGAALRELARVDEALTSCDRAISLRPGYADAYHTRGVCLLNKGDLEQAESMFLRALELKPDFPDAVFELTCIRKYESIDHPDVKNIRSLLRKPRASLFERDCLYFSLGKIYDDCGHYDEAFACYRLANQMRNRSVSYDPVKVAELTNSIIEVFSKELLAQPFEFVPDKPSPLFIVGMPRSGTTLIAQILSNHHGIGTAGELPTILDFLPQLPRLIGNGAPYPETARHLTPLIIAGLRNEYLIRLRRDAGSAVSRVIDKHPFNFRHLGLIAMLFPKARIIHCTRHPLDTGLSNYFQRFRLSYDYSFDLRNIGHFYGEYARIMEHWRRVLPSALIEVSYEDVITNTEQIVRKTLDSLGLEWDGRCLAPHTNPSTVYTASKWQVRQPIYRESVGRWRHYEKHLTSLKEMLQLGQRC